MGLSSKNQMGILAFSIQFEENQFPFSDSWLPVLDVGNLTVRTPGTWDKRAPGNNRDRYSWISFNFRTACICQERLNDVPPSSLCPLRRWSGAGVGVGMLRGRGTT